MWRPILLGAVFKVTGSGPLPSLPLKGGYSMRDMPRSARFSASRSTSRALSRSLRRRRHVPSTGSSRHAPDKVEAAVLRALPRLFRRQSATSPARRSQPKCWPASASIAPDRWPRWRACDQGTAEAARRRLPSSAACSARRYVIRGRRAILGTRSLRSGRALAARRRILEWPIRNPIAPRRAVRVLRLQRRSDPVYVARARDMGAAARPARHTPGLRRRRRRADGRYRGGGAGRWREVIGVIPDALRRRNSRTTSLTRAARGRHHARAQAADGRSVRRLHRDARRLRHVRGVLRSH